MGSCVSTEDPGRGRLKKGKKRKSSKAKGDRKGNSRGGKAARGGQYNNGPDARDIVDVPRLSVGSPPPSILKNTGRSESGYSADFMPVASLREAAAEAAVAHASPVPEQGAAADSSIKVPRPRRVTMTPHADGDDDPRTMSSRTDHSSSRDKRPGSHSFREGKASSGGNSTDQEERGGPAAGKSPLPGTLTNPLLVPEPAPSVPKPELSQSTQPPSRNGESSGKREKDDAVGGSSGEADVTATGGPLTVPPSRPQRPTEAASPTAGDGMSPAVPQVGSPPRTQLSPAPSPPQEPAPTPPVQRPTPVRPQPAPARKSAACVVIRGQMYDLDPLLGKHPGGSDILKSFNGRDATDAFLASHGNAPPFGALRKYLVPSAEL